jgi:L-lactate utilization protein LutC
VSGASRELAAAGVEKPGEAVALDTPELSTPDLLTQMEQEVTALGGGFVRCRADTLAEKIAAQIEQLGGGKVWTWEAAGFPPGLLEALHSRGVELTQVGDPSILTGLTGALAAAAETGSLALPGGAGQPLKASLLVENHLAVLRRSQIRATLEEVLSLPAMRQAAAGALVSGPSRTGDIELTLTVGVHGPKRIIIFCVEDM